MPATLAKGLLTLFLVFVLVSCGSADRRVVRPGREFDRNGDKIADRVQAGVESQGLLVALDHAANAGDLARIRALGGIVRGSWSALVYVVQVEPRPGRDVVSLATALARLPGVTFVDANRPVRGQLYYGTQQVAARPVWSMGTGYEGNPNQSIAILDSGIDATHPDLASKVTAWVDIVGANRDTPGDESATPTDKFGHGTISAGIAAGTGAAAGTGTGIGHLPITTATLFSSVSNTGMYLPFPVDTTGGSDYMQFRMKWQNTTAGHRVGMALYSDNPTTGPIRFWETNSDAVQPLSGMYFATPVGTWSVYNGQVYTNISNDNTPVWLQITTPVSSWNDGKNLMRGVAPGCKLVGVKVLDDAGWGNNAQVISGLDWVASHRQAYGIVAANVSVSGSSIDPLEDAAVNNLVASGVVCAVSAGNGRGGPYPTVGSPGSASEAITVGATDDADSVTDYSSYGSTGAKKPDLVAPGGIYHGQSDRMIFSVDSNWGDRNVDLLTRAEKLTADAFPDDYTGAVGTSVSSPFVAGAAALVAQAMGSWSFTEDQALRVKMLLLMTATETNTPAWAGPYATLDRGGRDICEGYGRLNVQAAIEALTKPHAIGSSETEMLSPFPDLRHCWARNVDLSAGTEYTFTLTVPPGADYDLYLYKDAYTTAAAASNDSAGDPIIAAKSTSASTGGQEQIKLTPAATGRHYLVVKWVSGTGQFTLSSTGPSVFSTTGQPVRAGWNLIALPAQPANADPQAVLAGIDVANSSLQYWRNDAAGGGYQAYGSMAGWTGPLTVGTPYWFLYQGSPLDVSFAGTAITSTRTLSFPALAPAPHWVMFGHPQNHATPCADLTFATTSHPAPLSWQAAVDAGVVDGKALGYSNPTSTFFTAGPSAYLPDKTTLDPWCGYWLLIRTSEAVTMNVP